jgi:integrase
VKGSVKRSGSGWGFVFDVQTIDGKRKQVRRRGFATRKAAEEALDAEKRRARGGELVTPSRLTLGQYLTNTWLPAVKPNVRPTTYDSYRRAVAKHIIGTDELPGIGGAQLKALDAASVARFLGVLADRGLAPKTVRNVHAILSKALGDAQSLNLASRNVAHGLKLPKLPVQQSRAWTAEQLRAFLAHVAADRWATMWRLLATTGMRRGEALGLRWADVDLERGVLTITNQRTIAGGVVVEGEPKSSAGRRSVSVDAGTLAALKSWRRSQAAERLQMGAGWRADYVFTWPDGSALWPQTVTSQFKAHAETLGFPAIGVHGLRHSAATWMIASGTSPKVVSQRLGHAHVSVTLQLYAHVLPAHDQAAADAFAAALDA